MYNKAAARLTDQLAIGIAFAGTSNDRFIAAGAELPRTILNHGNAMNNMVAEVLLRNGPRFWQNYASSEGFRKVACGLLTPAVARSLNRYATGVYKHLPYSQLSLLFCPETLLRHALHIDPEDESMVRFFQNDEHAAADRHTKTTLGRYLTQFYSGNYNENEIRDIGTHFRAKTSRQEFTLLTKSEDIVTAYINGPSSCMGKPIEQINRDLSKHPVSVYGDGADIMLAILGPIDAPTARALVWPEKKIFGRIYGDHYRLQEALQNAGYKHGSFEDAKINIIYNDNAPTNRRDRSFVLMPYIDRFNPNSTTQTAGSAAVKLHAPNAKFVTITERQSGDNVVNAGNTGGLALLSYIVKCDCCGARTHYHNAGDTWNPNNETDFGHLCQGCRNNDRYIAMLNGVGEGADLYIAPNNFEEFVRRKSSEGVTLGAYWASGSNYIADINSPVVSVLDETLYPSPIEGLPAYEYTADSSNFDIEENGVTRTIRVRNSDLTDTDPLQIRGIELEGHIELRQRARKAYIVDNGYFVRSVLLSVANVTELVKHGLTIADNGPVVVDTTPIQHTLRLVEAA